jgi:hypothetical protein
MKKLLALGLLSTLAASAFGQGQVNFQNRATTATPNAVISPIYLGSVGGTLLSGTDTQFHAALLGAATALGLAPANIGHGSRTNGTAGADSMGTLPMLASPSTAATWVTFRTGTLAGFLAVGTDSARDAVAPYNSTALFQVVAWSGGYNTWAQAYNAWLSGTPGVLIGASNPLTLPVTSSATALDVPTLQGLESFAIVPAPEPTTFALAGLGAAALMIFRRRNK